jgi:hypothetical protein
MMNRIVCPAVGLLVALAGMLGGCAGPDGGRGRDAAAYRGLQNQSIAVMVWADRGVRTDYPPIQVDLATAIQTKLRERGTTEVAGASFPLDPRSIVRFQQEHPLLQRAPITEIATRFNVTRLIYVELELFETRSPASAQLFRGSATATLRVVEVSEGEAKVGHEEMGIRAIYPPNAPPEGLPGGNDFVMYQGAVDRLSDEIVRRFVSSETRR